jgi:ABC-type transport system substrate-binding protein
VDGLFELGKLMPIEVQERERIVKEYNLDKVGIDAKAERAAIYAKINELVYHDQPYTYAFYKSDFYGFNKELRGYYFSPRGPFHYGPGFSSFWRFSP